MQKQVKTKTFLAIGGLVLTLLFSLTILTSNTSAGDAEKAKKEIEKAEQDQTTEKRKEILEEAASAIRETQYALKVLDEKKNKDALTALERATGKLEIILARDPELAMAPSGVNAATYDILADVNAVKSMRNAIEDAMDDGHLQAARRMIRNLASETVIRVTNIPLATYPDAIKLAVKHIDDGKIDEAKRILQTALNTLVIKDTIIPLPIVRAENILKETEKLAEKADRSEEDNKHLTDLLEGARMELEFAQALGYGTKRDFKNLYKQIDEIEDKTEGSKSGFGFFNKIKGYLKDAVKSSQTETQSDKDE